MPASILKRYAKDYGISIKKVEELWEASKEAAKQYNKPDDSEYYGVVIGLLKKMLKNTKKKTS